MTSVAHAARVRPRVIPSQDRAAVPRLLEDLVEGWLGDGSTGIVALHGQPGSGKSTALAYLGQRFASGERLVLLDEPGEEALTAADRRALVLCTFPVGVQPEALARLELAPWGEDERIEYLLATHRPMCASVLSRLGSSGDVGEWQGVPELCSAALDRMAADESLSGAQTALARHVEALFGWRRSRRRAASRCLRIFLERESRDRIEALRELERSSGNAYRFLRHSVVHTQLAAEALVDVLQRGKLDPEALRWIERELERCAAPLVRASSKAMNRLRLWLREARNPTGDIASLIHLAEPQALAEWIRTRDPERPQPSLIGARLERAPWGGLDLRRAHLSRTDLSAAVLRGANLSEAEVTSANFSDADLEQARLESVIARHALFCRARLIESVAIAGQFDSADFQQAVLVRASMPSARFQDANLSGARFNGAKLQGAEFCGATLQNTDFRGANLDSARMSKQDLRSCDLAAASLRHAELAGAHLDGMKLDSLQMESADLSGAHLTGASLRGAKLVRANLTGALLADIEAEDADLRDADLRRASFHMGSSRSGLVFHSPPMEGSRTGFYTDDYFDNKHKGPEEVRKANLRRADLRGAYLDDTDFYLVDLREARVTPMQYEHLRRCGAILSRH